jgi:hypothetical protein
MERILGTLPPPTRAVRRRAGRANISLYFGVPGCIIPVAFLPEADDYVFVFFTLAGRVMLAARRRCISYTIV